MRFAFVASLVFASSALACSSSDDGGSNPPDDTGVKDSFGVPSDTGDAGPDVTTDTPSDGPRLDGGQFTTNISDSSLYDDFKTKTINRDMLEFAPVYELWSDGAKKRRWVWIPPGQKIDTSDMDNWQFPVGTKFWKEFSTPDGKLLETRLIERTSDTTWRMGAYIWKPDGSDAIYSESGANNINGTEHDVPDLAKCQACHMNGVAPSPGKINGFQAIQLSKTGAGVNIGWLADNGYLSKPPPKGVMYPIPGNATESAALGYVHANCGHCHQPKWEFFALTNQVLRTTIDNTTVADSNVVKSTVYAPTTSFKGAPYRIVPGDSLHSAIAIRMGHRGDAEQMPPIATKVVDDTGWTAVKTWIDSLPKTPPPDAGTDAAETGSADTGGGDVGDAGTSD
jgi:hypothetical protein